MKTVLALVFGFGCVYGIQAQINAITSTGDQVILHENGTWNYVKESDAAPRQIETNPTPFVTDKASSFLVRSRKVNTGVWIDPKVWTFSKGKPGTAQEFSFKKGSDDLYALMISEEISVPLITLKELALDNARKAAPDIRIVKQEYRTVNEKRVLYMQMTGTLRGVRFVYHGYYFSNARGTIQLLAYTSERLGERFTSEIETFLNGFVEVDATTESDTDRTTHLTSDRSLTALRAFR